MKKRWLVIGLCIVIIGALGIAWNKSQSVAVLGTKTPLTIVIDPGHGGKDQGASRENVYEEDINFAVSLYLKQFLETADITVIMTRTMDIDLASESATNRKREDLKRRVEIMNGADLFVSIHMNVNESSQVVGTQVYYGKNKESSKELATMIQNQFLDFNQSKFLPTIGDYYILNETQTDGVLIECGFLSNDAERELLKDAVYQENLAYTISLGILEYINQ